MTSFCSRRILVRAFPKAQQMKLPSCFHTTRVNLLQPSGHICSRLDFQTLGNANVLVDAGLIKENIAFMRCATTKNMNKAARICRNTYKKNSKKELF